jgi:hypothetical protein
MNFLQTHAHLCAKNVRGASRKRGGEGVRGAKGRLGEGEGAGHFEGFGYDVTDVERFGFRLVDSGCKVDTLSC